MKKWNMLIDKLNKDGKDNIKKLEKALKDATDAIETGSEYYNSFRDAVDNVTDTINEVMGTTMIDYDIQSIAETKIINVFEHKEK